MLKRLFAPWRHENTLTGLVEALRDLEARLEVLEGEMHPARLVEWTELAEKLKRYLQRLSTVEQRLKQREDPDEPQDEKTRLRALLHTKYPGINGGS